MDGYEIAGLTMCALAGLLAATLLPWLRRRARMERGSRAARMLADGGTVRRI